MYHELVLIRKIIWLAVFNIPICDSTAQNIKPPSLNINDSAPSLKVSQWLKGEPFQTFQKGDVYVLEFWATWCKPCIAAMPRLTAIAHNYKNKLKVLGINVYEKKITPQKVKVFVDSMGERMDYSIAVDEDKFMETFWVKASGNQGIPKTIIINAEGKIAWIGHPKDLEAVVSAILDNTWDIKQVSAKWNLNKYLANLDDSLNYELMRYRDNDFKEDYIGKPYDALLVIGEIIKNEPRLQYAPFIAYNTFSSLLKTNLQKAYEYGKVVLVTPTYEEPAFDAIIGAVKTYSTKVNFTAEIYQLGAEAYQMKIDQTAYPEIVDTYKYYNDMAEWYWFAGDKSKAIEAQQKAVDVLKSKKYFSEAEMNTLKSCLQQYKKM